MMKKQTLFDAVGGLPVIERVHKRFYDKVYAHPWLGKFFAGHDQTMIELRQTQFMAKKMGANILYTGHELSLAHRRMYISEELLKVRQGLLRTSLVEEGIDENLIDRWLRVDHAFWGKVRNESLEDFFQIDHKYEKPLVIEKPVTG